VAEFDRDPLEHFVEVFYGDRGLLRSAELLLERGAFGSAVIVTYATIDTISNLARPSGAAENNRRHFIEWCDRWLRIPSTVPLHGIDLYAARCAVLHTYGSEAALTKSGKATPIGYRAGKGAPPNIAVVDEGISSRVAIVQVEKLLAAVRTAINDCLPELFASPEQTQLTENRLQKVLGFLPYRLLWDVQ